MSGTHCIVNAYILLSPVREPGFERWLPYQALMLVPVWMYVVVLAAIPELVG